MGRILPNDVRTFVNMSALDYVEAIKPPWHCSDSLTEFDTSELAYWVTAAVVLCAAVTLLLTAVKTNECCKATKDSDRLGASVMRMYFLAVSALMNIAIVATASASCDPYDREFIPLDGVAAWFIVYTIIGIVFMFIFGLSEATPELCAPLVTILLQLVFLSIGVGFYAGQEDKNVSVATADESNNDSVALSYMVATTLTGAVGLSIISAASLEDSFSKRRLFSLVGNVLRVAGLVAVLSLQTGPAFIMFSAVESAWALLLSVPPFLEDGEKSAEHEGGNAGFKPMRVETRI
jgi:hypothetical protein